MSHPDFAALRADVLDLADEIAGIAPPASFRTPLDALPRDLAAPFSIVVCGEFSRGKSSLLNAMVGRPDLFPTDIAVTTSVVSELHWARTETAIVAEGEGELTGERVPLDRIAEYVTEQRNPHNGKGVRTVRLTAPVEALRDGLVLVDTPGIGSLNVEHATATYAYLGRADVVLFVASADERMSTTELDYLATAMDRCPTVITVVTKIDKLVPPGPDVEVANARRQIAGHTGTAPEEVLVLGVSARRKLNALARGDDALLDRSGFPALEDLLWRRLTATLGAARLRSALDVLGAAVRAQAVPVADELTALSSDGTLQEVRERLERQRAEAERLASRTAAWRRELDVACAAGMGAARAELAAECADLERDLRSRAHDDEVLDEPRLLLREVATALVDIELRAGERLRAAADAAADAVTRENGLALAPYAWSPGVPVDVELDLPEGIFDFRARGGRWRTGLENAANAAGLGGIVSPLLAPVAPWAAPVFLGLSSMIGWVIGLRGYADQAKRELRTRRLDVLTETVLPKIHAYVEQVHASFDEAADRTRNALIDEFDGAIGAARESLGESIASLEDLRTANERERDRRHRELRERQRRIRGLADRVAALREQVDTMADADPGTDG